MNVLVINGSPKGQYSTTLQTSLFLEILHPEHTFSYLNAGQKVRAFEKDFSEAEAALSAADVIIFSYPVYTFLVPSQLHRFIELIKESNIDISGKFVTQISTSKHFYDVTAHNFIRDNCFDLGLRYVKGFSADMDDLTTEKGQREAETFFDYFLWCVNNDISEPNNMCYSDPKHRMVTIPDNGAEKDKRPGDVVVVADLAEEDIQLATMIKRFSAVSSRSVRAVNIRSFPFKGGCISCFNCSVDGTCIYKDGFADLLRNDIQTAEAIVLAFSIKDHSMGSIFKTYDDRQFCNGHRTVTMGKPFAYLVSGNLSEEENLRMVIDGRAEVGGNFLAGVATDEFNPDADIDALAKKLSYAVENSYIQPANFLGVGGMKIFRDLIWLMQGMMKADHKFYKAHGQYDFPQKKRGRMLAMYFVGGMMGNKKLKEKMGNKMNEGMIMPYKKALENARKRIKGVYS